MFDWLIIGGGLHGCHLACLLLQRKRPPTGRLRILDPHDHPLHVWDTLTTRVGMDFLRSPSVHHLDAEPMALQRFSYHSITNERERFLGPYSRPALELFRAHSQQVLAQGNVERHWHRGEAASIVRTPQGWQVETSAGPMITRRLVLAPGMARQPAWPQWAREARDSGAPIQHLFDENFDVPSAERSLLIVGGGITAAQFALAAIRRNQRQVTLVCRHPLRVHTFDSDPGWMGPKYLDAFHAEPDWQRRRHTIAQARQRGTMPEEILAALRQQQAAGRLRVVEGEPLRAKLSRGDCRMRVQLACGASEQADHVVLCTGFHSQRPGGQMLDHLVDKESLPVAGCGYPIVPPSLEWAKGLFVMGALAELQVGPVARNIAGARMAATRILAATEAAFRGQPAVSRNRASRTRVSRLAANASRALLRQRRDD